MLEQEKRKAMMLTQDVCNLFLNSKIIRADVDALRKYKMELVSEEKEKRRLLWWILLG